MFLVDAVGPVQTGDVNRELGRGNDGKPARLPSLSMIISIRLKYETKTKKDYQVTQSL